MKLGVFMSEAVREFYDKHAQEEWRRLFQDAYHKLEFLVTMHFLDKYLPRSGLILDAGAGPGRYSIELAKKGYDVVLMDIWPKCLEIAKREIKSANVEEKVRQILEGSIVDLKRFDDESFDAVICLGPLSHLINKADREKVLNEILRVVKKNAPIFVSVINKYGVYRTVLQELPELLVDPSHKETFTKGIHRAHYLHPREPHGGFTDAYFFHPTELRELFETKGVETLEMATCEGLSSHLQEATNRVYDDKEKWRRWLKLIYQTCNDPAIIGTGEHLLYVGRKK
jgi:2-polyprenyl-3-methyl-5-hydroxy-6-metoxy-1,4-benzoquinol methylase